MWMHLPPEPIARRNDGRSDVARFANYFTQRIKTLAGVWLAVAVPQPGLRAERALSVLRFTLRSVAERCVSNGGTVMALPTLRDGRFALLG